MSPISINAQIAPHLRELLANAGYSHARVQQLLGATARGFVDLTSGPLAMWKTRGATALETLIRLFVIGATVPMDQAEFALAPMGVHRGVDAGVLRHVTGRDADETGRGRSMVESTLALVPFEDLILAADFSRRDRGAVASAPDHVMGVGRSSAALGRLALGDYAQRRAGDGHAGAGSVLDLGCGCGYLALSAAAMADRVVGTDLNARAVELSTLNSALNGISRVEFRQGSLFDPVHDERFDLIVSNPPFVISPERGLVYRDAGATAGFAGDAPSGPGSRRAGDELCEQIVRKARNHLTEGGELVMLLNWSHTADIDWRQRLRGWVSDDLGGAPGPHDNLQAWIIRTDTQDVGEYASMWIRHTLAGEPGWSEERFFERFDAWMAYYAAMGVEAISYGAIVLRRASPAFFEVDDVDSSLIDRGHISLGRAMAGRAVAQGLSDDAAILAGRWLLAEDVHISRTAPVGEVGGAAGHERRAVLMMGASQRAIIAGGEAAVEVLRRCNGRQMLGRLVEESAAMLGISKQRLASETASVARAMIREGAMTETTTGH